MRIANQTRASHATDAAWLNDGIHGDLLRGAEAIAVFMFNDPAKTRAVYALRAKRWPFFKLGRDICARRSAIIEHIQNEETRRAA